MFKYSDCYNKKLTDFLFLFLWFESFLVLDELLFHYQVILDSLQLQQFEPASRVWSYCNIRSTRPALSFVHAQLHHNKVLIT